METNVTTRETFSEHRPWNKGKLIGQKPPLQTTHWRFQNRWTSDIRGEAAAPLASARQHRAISGQCLEHLSSFRKDVLSPA